MTPLQGEPPKIDFKLPKKLKRFLAALRQFCIEAQPLNGVGLTLSQTVKGRLLKASAEDGAVSAAATAHRLQLVAANASGVPKVRVRLGYVAGQKAGTGMSDPDDDPIFTETLPSAAGTYYIYCDVTVKYEGGVWLRNSATANTVNYSTDDPVTHVNTATKIYVHLGTVTVAAITGGYAVTVVATAVSGDQWVARQGNASSIDGVAGNR